MPDSWKVYSAEPDSWGSYFGKLRQYKNLIATFAKRELKTKYAQTYLGAVWVLLQPLPTVLIFTFFFSRLIKVDTGLLPYPVFALTGIIGWQYFTSLITNVGNSLLEGQAILKKMYFPKLILPCAKVVVSGIDFFASFLLLLAALLIYQLLPAPAVLYFPLFFLLNTLVGFAIGILLSALTIRYRDYQYLIPQILNFGIWLTPVFYPRTILPAAFASLMYWNPMAFVIEGYRYCLVGGMPPSSNYLYSILPTLLLLIIGLIYFKSGENKVADYL